MYDLIVVGGGAAGIFAAIQAQAFHPNLSILVLEKSAKLLSKVRISGGGRCNVTHHCFEPRKLVQHYPRGNKELISAFTQFGPADTIAWFESRGVPLKAEADGRMFPISNQSASIIDCLLTEAQKLGVEIRMRQNIEAIEKSDQGFCLKTEQDQLICQRLLLATGSSRQGYEWAKNLGHTIQTPVASLFGINISPFALADLTGVSLPDVRVKIGKKEEQRGPLLITHFGFSGPAILKLSAWQARKLAEKDYQTQVVISWLPDLSVQEIYDQLVRLKAEKSKKSLLSLNPFTFPKKLWRRFLEKAMIDPASLSQILANKELLRLANLLFADPYAMTGKTTNREEFVTCGGVLLKEVDFKTMQSKSCPGLFFAGEILDVDGVTGGFNFQNCWTTAFLVAKSLI